MSGISRSIAFVIAGLALLAAPSAAGAAVVTNGDFETATLSGWQTGDVPQPPSGSWVAYSGTVSPLGHSLIVAPPQGKYAATSDQGGPGLHVMYQDVTLPPGGTQYQLSLFVYYRTVNPIASPNSLDYTVSPNQQYRIDVMKPGTAIDSVAAGDIIKTVFRTMAGDPMTLAPTQMTADLTGLAGQTVRLRFAEVDNTGTFLASTDAVAVSTNEFTIGSATRNKKKGTAKLPVTVQGPGTLTLSGNGVKSSSASKSVAVQGGTVNLLVKATGKTRLKLNSSGKAKVKVNITYTPTGLSPLSHTQKVKLQKKR